jgi:hypothetical protein
VLAGKCSLEDVPPANRIDGHFNESTQHYCFAFADDAAVDVTPTHVVECER